MLVLEIALDCNKYLKFRLPGGYSEKTCSNPIFEQNLVIYTVYSLISVATASTIYYNAIFINFLVHQRKDLVAK